jgi:hypothetical protein
MCLWRRLMHFFDLLANNLIGHPFSLLSVSLNDFAAVLLQ